MKLIPYSEISARYAEEQRNHPVALTAEDIPLGFETITPQWLTQVMCDRHPGVEVTSFQLSEPDEGTSSRRRLFLQYNAAGRNADLPASVFCKSTHTLTSRARIGCVGFVEAEVNFYRSIRELLDIEAPRCWFANVNEYTFNSIVILHDMTGLVDFCRYDVPVSRERAESQLRLLASLHARFCSMPALGTEYGYLETWAEQFTYLSETPFKLSCMRGFDMAGHVIPPRLFSRQTEIYPATLLSAQSHASLPNTIIHSDVHLRNWYVSKSGEMGLNDWQCLCRGHWSRDLAYVLSTSLSISDRRAWERDLIAYYLDRLQAAGGPRSGFDFAWRHYRAQLLGALAWWTGTLGQPSGKQDMQPPEVSLEFIRRITTAMDDLDALDAVM
jgi:hypothetical protein